MDDSRSFNSAFLLSPSNAQKPCLVASTRQDTMADRCRFAGGKVTSPSAMTHEEAGWGPALTVGPIPNICCFQLSAVVVFNLCMGRQHVSEVLSSLF
eukprot:1754750-Rhodomonas_salina.1